MKYGEVLPGIFASRPNRFIARVELEGRTEDCHVKNTGRLGELLAPGARVYLQRAANPARKTRYDLLSVHKGDTLFNIDSAAPGKVFAEWLREGGLGQRPTLLRPEVRYGDSRLDFYFETPAQKAYVEVKGVTLEEQGRALFPDAPTQRGLRHIEELCHCRAEGYEAYIAFIIQMRGVSAFSPNNRTQPAFGAALARAAQLGVRILALDCDVTPGAITARCPVPVEL